MLTIKRATKSDLPAVSYLMQQSGKMDISESHFNNKDIALQARLDSGELVGFLWGGLMAKGSICYLDKFIVDVNLSGGKIGHALAKAMHDELLRRKIKTVFGIIKQDQYHDKSAFNALRMAIGGDSHPYTLVVADVAHATSQLKGVR